MAATLIGFGFALGQAWPTSTAKVDLYGVGFGSVQIDGAVPTAGQASNLTVRIEGCDDTEIEPIVAEVDALGQYEVAGLPVEQLEVSDIDADTNLGSPSSSELATSPEEFDRSCYVARASYELDDSGPSIDISDEVYFSRAAIGNQFKTLKVVSGTPQCANPDGSLAIRFVTSGLLADTARVDAAKVALDEITAAGDSGESGLEPVVVFGGTTEIRESPTDEEIQAFVEELIDDCIDAVVTHLGSQTSQAILPSVTGAGIIQFSPNATAPTLGVSDDNDLFFRTAPSDEIQGRVLARDLEEANKSQVAVAYLDDLYGSSLKAEFENNFLGGVERQGLTAEYSFSLEDTIAPEQIAAMVNSDPQAVLVIGYDAESADVVRLLDQNNYDDGDDATGSVWLVDGNPLINEELSNPGFLENARQTIPGYDPDAEALSDLRDGLSLEPGDLLPSFAAQTYDAVVILGLAAAAADGGDASLIAAQINGVTKDSTSNNPCTTYASCLGVIENGNNLDYDGVGGPYEFTDAGEPSQAYYQILNYGLDGKPDPQQTIQTLESICYACRGNTFSERIEFDDGSAAIRPQLLEHLMEVAEDIKQTRPGLSVEIAGYASPSGSEETNCELSIERAEAVRTHLVEVEGVPNDLLTAVGRGETDAEIQDRAVLFRETEKGSESCDN